MPWYDGGTMTTPYRPFFLLDRKIKPGELSRLTQIYFHDLVKVVVDPRRRVICAGGRLHWDARDLLIKDGSRPQDLWGVNYYPDQPKSKCTSFISQINERPDDPSASVRGEELRRQLREIIYEFVGRGQPVWWELEQRGRDGGLH